MVILVGVDDSVTSLRAGAYAAGLARRQGARLVVVYVEQPSALYGAAAGAGADVIAEQERAFSETAADLKQRLEGGAAGRGGAGTVGGCRSRASPRSATRSTSCGGWRTRSARTPWWSARPPRPGTG